MIELLSFINYLIELYKYIIIASVILSWLMAFGVVNPYNRFVRSLAQALAAVTEPLLRPIRNALPDMGGLDLLAAGAAARLDLHSDRRHSQHRQAVHVTLRTAGAPGSRLRPSPGAPAAGASSCACAITPKSSKDAVDGIEHDGRGPRLQGPRACCAGRG